jgi:septum site-determining protein MinC
MPSDSALPDLVSTVPAAETVGNLQVRFKSEEGRLLLILPAEAQTPVVASWNDLWQQMKQRLNGGDRFWQPNTTVHLMASDRLLDVRQLQAIADALAEVQLQLKCVYTSRRQTAVAAATVGYSVEQQPPFSSLNQTPTPAVPIAEPLYLKMTVRSGVEIRHAGTAVILGDINPGGIVVADGDILVWGRLRGIAHAGAAGNSKCMIMALQMEPTQLRIADYVARAPQTQPAQFYPEIAYVTPEGIRITKAADFSKSQFLSKS